MDRIDKIEAQARKYFHELKKNHIDGPWNVSPVEEQYQSIRESILDTPGMLRNFKTNFLSAGRLNFPDNPNKSFYFDWTSKNSVPLTIKIKGYYVLFKLAFILYRYKRYQLEEIQDSSTENYYYFFPKSFFKLVKNICFFILGREINKDDFYQITEAKIRFYYYQNEIKENLKENISIVLETGGGYGGLAEQIISNHDISRYYIVDISDALPLAYFYLRSRLKDDIKIQVLSKRDDTIEDDSKIILLPASRMDDIQEPIDIYISTMSLQHQRIESVTYYMDKASSLKAKYMFLVERDTIRDKTDTIISDYPFPTNYEKIVWKKWLFGEHILAIFKKN